MRTRTARDPGVRRRRLRPRLRPPGRARPGGLLRLLQPRDPRPSLTALMTSFARSTRRARLVAGRTYRLRLGRATLP
jgi:hypothetical protein